MKHFGQTYKRISVWWLLIAQSTMTWKQLHERCVFTFQQSNTEDANPALFVSAWKSWGYLIFTNKKSFQSSLWTNCTSIAALFFRFHLVFPIETRQNLTCTEPIWHLLTCLNTTKISSERITSQTAWWVVENKSQLLHLTLPSTIFTGPVSTHWQFTTIS